MKEVAAANGWPTKVEVGLIGSCTNSSYEDISRAVSLAKQVSEKNLKTKAEYLITPGSEQVRYTIERDGFLEVWREDEEQFRWFARGCALEGRNFLRWGEVADEPARGDARPTGSALASFSRFWLLRFDPMHTHRNSVRANLSPLARVATIAQVFYVYLVLDDHRCAERDGVVLHYAA
jgi:hypothetical protein